MPNTTETTTSQIIVPGLEKAIGDIITPAIAANNTAVGSINTAISNNLSSLAGKFASPVISRNNNEPSPYPTFAIWTNQNNDTKAGFNIVNSDFQSIASNAMPGWFGSYQNPALDNMPNWYEDHRGQTYTNSQQSSGRNTTYSGNSTVAGSADGHNYYRPCLHGGFAGNWMNQFDQHAYFTARCGTIIGARGVRQRVSHHNVDSEFQVRARGMSTGYYDRVDLNSATYATWAGRSNRGMSSYNDRTKMLAVAESNTSNQIRLHVWRNTSLSLNNFSHKPGTLHKFLSEAKSAGPSATGVLGADKSYSFYDFTWSHAGSNRNEPSYHMKLVMGDNGVIGFARFNHDGYAQRYGHWTVSSTGSAGNSGTGVFTDTEINLGNTTSYGIDQDERYGIRHNITWDNEWIAAYSPYYYYESGINCHTISTVDPTKLFWFRVTNTASGHGVVPFKEDKFISVYSEQNGDSPGPHLYVIDPGSAGKNFRRTDGSTLSYGADLQPYNVVHHYQFDTHSNTTQYPHIVSMPHWSNP